MNLTAIRDRLASLRSRRERLSIISSLPSCFLLLLGAVPSSMAFDASARSPMTRRTSNQTMQPSAGERTAPHYFMKQIFIAGDARSRQQRLMLFLLGLYAPAFFHGPA